MKIIEALDKATVDDLAECDTLIEALEKRLDALKSVRKLLHIKINGKTRRGPAPGALIGKAMGNARIAVAKYLLHAGTTRPRQLAIACNLPEDKIDKVLSHQWFENTQAGVVLTKEGRQAVG